MTTPPHTRHLRLVAAFALSSALLVACNDDDGQGQATTASATATPTTEVSVITTTAGTTTTVAATTTSPTMAATTTVPATTSPPTSQQIDWIPIVEELYNRRFALLAAPDVARVGEVAVVGSPLHDRLVRDLTEFVANGWHDTYEPREVARIDVDYADAAPDGTVLRATLTVWQQSGGVIAIVDVDGNVVFPVTLEEPPPGTLSRNGITIERASGDQPWLFVDEVNIEPAAP